MLVLVQVDVPVEIVAEQARTGRARDRRPASRPGARNRSGINSSRPSVNAEATAAIEFDSTNPQVVFGRNSRAEDRGTALDSRAEAIGSPSRIGRRRGSFRWPKCRPPPASSRRGRARNGWRGRPRPSSSLSSARTISLTSRRASRSAVGTQGTSTQLSVALQGLEQGHEVPDREGVVLQEDR